MVGVVCREFRFEWAGCCALGLDNLARSGAGYSGGLK